MPIYDLPTFEELCRRQGGIQVNAEDNSREVANVVQYLRQLGFAVATAEDVLAASIQLLDEEEISAERCKEGVAVSHASDGWWLLLPDGNIFDNPACGVILGDHRC